jgi:hypothetical protein
MGDQSDSLTEHGEQTSLAATEPVDAGVERPISLPKPFPCFLSFEEGGQNFTLVSDDSISTSSKYTDESRGGLAMSKASKSKSGTCSGMTAHTWSSICSFQSRSMNRASQQATNVCGSGMMSPRRWLISYLVVTHSKKSRRT